MFGQILPRWVSAALLGGALAGAPPVETLTMALNEQVALTLEARGKAGDMVEVYPPSAAVIWLAFDATDPGRGARCCDGWQWRDLGHRFLPTATSRTDVMFVPGREGVFDVLVVMHYPEVPLLYAQYRIVVGPPK